MKLGTVRGMRDILPPETRQWQGVEASLRTLFQRYAYREIRPPVVELAELFARGVGAETDIVHKEMYVFPDRKGQMLALRPEATASVVRAYVEHGMRAAGDLVKLYYLGPMFRYEKPQKGRQRQFHQYGVEAIGSLDPALDAEVASLSAHLVGELGLDRARLRFRVNTIGCAADRPVYREALLAYLAPKGDALCSDCRRRMEGNPLRILDCKAPGCREVLGDAPSSADHVCSDCAGHFASFKRHMEALGLAYEQDPSLVRGLDYYTRTVFELASEELGAQDALLGGGRYDDLVALMGGPPTPAVGFAGGLERLVMLMASQEQQGPELDWYVIPITDAAEVGAWAGRIVSAMRRAGLAADRAYVAKSLRKSLQVAARKAKGAVFIGPEEVAEGKAKVRDLSAGSERAVSLAALVDPHALLVELSPKEEA